MDVIVVDFETEAIEKRPKYPPKPVGVSIQMPGRKSFYLAWGHPTANNCDKAKARKVLGDVWRSGKPLLFHNAKFDLDVANVHFDLRLPEWDRVHDTLFLLFLHDPHARSLSLKPSAERILGMPPTEQEAVRHWLIEHGVVTAGDKAWGAHISKAPGDLVGKYAIGDVVRTFKLFNKLYPELDDRERGAYDRERKLLPILLRNEAEGLRLSPTIEDARKEAGKSLQLAERWLQKRLGVRDLNLDADAEVAQALRDTGVVTNFVKTKKTGRDSVSKANLTIERFNDRDVFHVWAYRNKLQTVLANSLDPWCEEQYKGRIYTEWNQVRQSHGDENVGARTGRLSCSRFLNIAKDLSEKKDGMDAMRVLTLVKGAGPIPNPRTFILPEKGHWWIHRDYAQQEFRILGHYEGGAVMRSYRADPKMDYHDMVGDNLQHFGLGDVDRGDRKIVNFGILYGMGAAKLAVKLKVPVERAKEIMSAIKAVTPGVTSLNKALKAMGRDGEPIRTWGGRRYYCEPPRLIDSGPRKGEMQTFEYKLLNYLIQGSAADCTKEAVIRWHEVAPAGSRFLIAIHDEINVSAADPLRASSILEKVMRSVEFDVPMLSEAKYGKCWGSLAKEI